MLPKKPAKTSTAKPTAKKATGQSKPKASAKPAPKSSRVKGLSLKQLVRSTPAYYKNKSVDDGVVVSRYNPNVKTKQSGLPAITAITYSSARKSPRPKYKTSVIGLELGVPIYKQERVRVSCSCEDFTYTWEYADWTHNAAQIRYSNGEPARLTNPQNTPGLCKHLVALAYEIITNKD